MRQVYMDYQSTTPVREEVLQKMLPYFTENFGNPSGMYDLGDRSKKAVEKAREQVAGLINCQPDELMFCSCGSEADNWVMFGVPNANRKKGNHIITTAIEHHAILNSGDFLKNQDLELTVLPVDREGFVDPDEFAAAIKENTVLASVIYVNNEVGTVQDIRKLSDIAHEHGVLFHTDAVQALGNVNCDVEALGVDLMSMSAQKIYAPKGIAALYVRKGVKISNYLHGGQQEGGKRPGTENVPGIVGFGKACELVSRDFDAHVQHLASLRNYLADRILTEIEDTELNGPLWDRRHPGNLNITFKYIEGESILLLLNLAGISASTGSACNSASLEPSHVLTALGVPPEVIHGTIRFCVGDLTTKEDIDYVVEETKKIVEKLRAISAVSAEKGW